MLDLTGLYDGTGNTSLTAMATAASGEIHTVTNSGVSPLKPMSGAALVAWGAQTVATADSIKEVKLNNQDLWDPSNNSDWKPAGTSVSWVSPLMHTYVMTDTSRLVSYAQKAAGAVSGYTIDHYPTEGITGGVNCGYFPNGISPAGPKYGAQSYPVTLNAATAAGTWTSTVWTPNSFPNAGRYALLGWGISNLTTTTATALITFDHPDFKGFRPGLPCADLFTGTQTTTNMAGEPFYTTHNYWQFVRMSEFTGQPECPIFHITNSSTSLKIWIDDLNTDTATINLNLLYLGQ